MLNCRAWRRMGCRREMGAFNFSADGPTDLIQSFDRHNHMQGENVMWAEPQSIPPTTRLRRGNNVGQEHKGDLHCPSMRKQ